MKKLLLVILLALVPLSMLRAWPSHRKSAGTDFWVVFMPVDGMVSDSVCAVQDACHYRLTVVGRDTATVVVENPQTGWNTSIQLQPSQPAILDVPYAQCQTIQNTPLNAPSNSGIHVSATSPVQVYSHIVAVWPSYTRVIESALVLPYHALSTRYLAHAVYEGNNGNLPAVFNLNNELVAIVATSDSTTVYFTPGRTTDLLISQTHANVIRLNRGQVFSARGTYSLGVSEIVANKPVAVFQGGLSLGVSGVVYKSSGWEQTPALRSWGTRFIIPKTPNSAQSTHNYPYGLLAITSCADNTVVDVDGQRVVLGRNQYSMVTYRNRGAGAAVVTSNNPIMVNSVAEGCLCGTLVTVPPLEQMADTITVVTHLTDVVSRQLLKVVVPERGISSCTFDGVPLNFSNYLRISGRAYYYATLTLTEGTHTLISPFGAQAYQAGISTDESIAYACPVEYGVDSINGIPVSVHLYDTAHWCLPELPAAAYDDSIRSLDVADFTEVDARVHMTTYYHHTVYPHMEYTRFDTADIYPGEQFVWHGHTYTQPGHVALPGTTVAGCDSSFYLLLRYRYRTVEQRYLCDGEEFFWRGKHITQPGSYTDRQITAAGADSLLVLEVTAGHPFSHSDTLVLTAPATCRWQGRTCGHEGVYTAEYVGRNGCDSVYELHLFYRYERLEQAGICRGDTYMWHGRELTEEGRYVDSLLTRAGYDSICTLDLELAGRVDSVSVGYVCADDGAVSFRLVYDRPAGLSYAIRFDSLAHARGFADVPATPLADTEITVPFPPADPYLRPDIYGAEVSISSPYCPDSPRLFNLRFEVRYPAWIIRQKWDDMLGVLNAAYNGGYSFSAIGWYRNGQPMQGASGDIFSNGSPLSGADTYQVLLTRADDGVSILSCEFVPSQTTDLECLPADAAPQKLMRSGRLLILTPSGTFDLLGRRVEP